MTLTASEGVAGGQLSAGAAPNTGSAIKFWRLARYLAVLVLPALIFRSFASSYFSTTAVACTAFQAFRMSQLEGTEAEQSPVIEQHRRLLFRFLIFGGFAWAIDASTSAAIIHWVSVGTTIYLGGTVLVIGTRGTTSAAPVAVSDEADVTEGICPSATISADDILLRRTRIAADCAQLAKTRLFGAGGAELKAAWGRRSNEAIEALLRAGDAQIRAALERAGDCYNAAVCDVDLTRTSLQARLVETEDLLRRYAIDYAAIEPPPSKVLEITSQAFERRKLMLEQLSYGGMGSGLARVLSGQTSWQVAALGTAAVVAWHLIARSKALRQLKEAEGQIVRNAKAARGDIQLVVALIETRLLPQLDQVIDLFRRLDEASQVLRRLADARMGDQQEKREERPAAVRLAFVLVEGNHLLETMAGD